MSVVQVLLGRIKDRLDTQLKVLIKNSSWIFAANGVRTVLAFLKSVIIARGLGAELFGNYVLILAFVTTVQEFFNLNIGTAVIKFGADFREAGRGDKLVALLKVCLLASVALAVVSVLFIYGAAEVAYDTFIGAPGLEIYVVLFAIVSGTSFLDSISKAVLKLYFKFRLNSLLQMIAAIIDVVFMAVILFLFPFQLEPFLIAMIVAKLMDSLVINGSAAWEMWGDLKANAGAKIGLIGPERRPILSFVFSNSGSRTLTTLIDRGDVLLLGAFASAQQVGLYEIAKKLAYTVLRFTDPLVGSIYPQIARLISQKQYHDVTRMLGKMMAILAGPCLLVLFAAFFAKEWVMVSFYGREFAAAGDTFYVHLIMAVISALLFWTLPTVQSLGKVHMRLVIVSVAAVLGAGLAYVLAPRFGALGVAYASLIVKSFVLLDMMLVAFVVLRRESRTLQQAHL